MTQIYICIYIVYIVQNAHKQMSNLDVSWCVNYYKYTGLSPISDGMFEFKLMYY